MKQLEHRLVRWFEVVCLSAVELTLVPAQWRDEGLTYELLQQRQARALRPLYGERVFARWWAALANLDDGTVGALAAQSSDLAESLRTGQPGPWLSGEFPILCAHAPEALLASAKPVLPADRYEALAGAIRATQEGQEFFDAWEAGMKPFRSAERWPADVEIRQTAGPARWPHVLTQVGLYGAVPPIVSREVVDALQAAGITAGYSTADATLVSRKGDRIDTHVALFVEEDLAVRPRDGDPDDPWADGPWLTLEQQPGPAVAIRQFSGGVYVRDDGREAIEDAGIRGVDFVALEPARGAG